MPEQHEATATVHVETYKASRTIDPVPNLVISACKDVGHCAFPDLSEATKFYAWEGKRLVGAMLNVMPGALTSAIFAAFARHYANVFVVPERRMKIDMAP